MISTSEKKSLSFVYNIHWSSPKKIRLIPNDMIVVCWGGWVFWRSRLALSFPGSTLRLPRGGLLYSQWYVNGYEFLRHDPVVRASLDQSQTRDTKRCNDCTFVFIARWETRSAVPAGHSNGTTCLVIPILCFLWRHKEARIVTCSRKRFSAIAGPEDNCALSRSALARRAARHEARRLQLIADCGDVWK